MYQFLTTNLAETYTFIVDESQLFSITYLFIFIYNYLKVHEDKHYITWDTHSNASGDVVLIVTGEGTGSPTLLVDLALGTFFLWLCYRAVELVYPYCHMQWGWLCHTLVDHALGTHCTAYEEERATS